MKRRALYLACSLSMVVACDDPPEQQGPVGLGGLDASMQMPDDNLTDATAVGDGGRRLAAAPPPRVGPAYAVINSDWTATAISILDFNGEILADDYLNSGSAKAGLVTALSGDVELPKRSGEPGILVVLDRFKTDVITRIRLSDGMIVGQVKTHTPADQTSASAYTSNPQDYVYIDEQTAWITRGQPNIAEGGPAIDRGDDLFRINPSKMERAGERIDLWGFNQSVMRADPNTAMSSQVTLHARPSRMVRLGNTLVVGISRSAYDFKAVGKGVIALVDLTTRAVTPFELDGLKSCTGIDAVVTDNDSVLVSCGGDLTATEPKATAGIAMVKVTGATASIEHVYRAAADPSPALVRCTVSLGGTLVGACANDYSGKNPDVFAILDLATGQKTTLLSLLPGTGRFGTPAYDAQNRLLMLPDASVDANKKPTAGLRRFRHNEDNTFSELGTIRTAESSAMPVRHVYPL